MNRFVPFARIAHSFIVYVTCIALTTSYVHAVVSGSWSRMTTSVKSRIQGADGMKRFSMHQSLRTCLSGRGSLVIRDVPVGSEGASTLELESVHSVFDQRTIFLTPGAKGDEPTPAPELHCWRGHVAGQPRSHVFMCLSSAGVLASITLESGERWSVTSEIGSPEIIIVAAESELSGKLKTMMDCASPDLPREYMRKNPPRILSNELLELELALETDSEFFTASGSDLEKAKAYAMAMMSLVSDVYEREVKVRIYVPWYTCWTTSPRDPYNAAGNPFTLRDKAIPYWTANRSNVQRDLYHVITAISYGGGGYGYLDQLCKPQYGMASSSIQVQHTYPTYAFNYDVYIVAHELGHNFNAQHTHSCFFGYPLDTCVVDDAIKGGCLPAGTTTKPNAGSIMSYCGGPNASAGKGYQMRMTFLPQNIALMRQTAESASCITAPPKPSVVLVSPRGSESFSVRSPLTIEYLSTRVAGISFDVSYDDGRSWKQILGDVDPTRGSIQWTPPDTCSNNVKIRMRSTDDSTVNDVTTLPFALYKDAPSALLASYEFAGDYVNSVCGGFDNAMSVNGEVKFVADRFGLKDSAVAFNGSAYLVAPSADLQSPVLSVSMWCRPDSLSGKNTMLGTNYGPGTNVFEIYNWGILGCSYYLNSGLWQFWSGGLAPKTWSHIVFSYDGSTARTWINNRLVKSETKKGVIVPFITSLYFGSRKGNEPFYGALDDIKIFRKALDSSDVAGLYKEKAAPQRPTLILPADNEQRSDSWITFRWTRPAGATRFRLVAASSSDFAPADVVVDSVVQDDSCRVRISDGLSTLYWRVQAENAFGASDMSDTRTLLLLTNDVADRSEPPCFHVRQTDAELILDMQHCGELIGDAVLCDIVGRVVYHRAAGESAAQTMRIPLHGLARGFYVLRFADSFVGVRIQ